MQVTEQTLKPIAQVGTETLKRFIAPLQECFTKYKIDTPARQMAFLAQVGHESGGLFYTEEIASGKAYEGRGDLGNTRPGDGVKFKGRGIIQITGRANYYALSQDLGTDFIINPTLLGGKNAKVSTDKQLRNAVMSAGWFWNKKALNTYADQINIAESMDTPNNEAAFKKITKIINGGYNGLADRVSKFRLLQKAWK